MEVTQLQRRYWWRHLDAFNVSRDYGFLVENPLDHLPGYFSPWEYLGKNAFKFMESGNMRSEVKKLPLLDYNELKCHREYCMAHMLLSTIAHCYVWQDGEAPKVLPKAVAVPWYHISQRLGLNPVYCYLDGMLANWNRIEQSKEFDLSNSQMICVTPGSPRTEWFSLVAIQVEVDFATGIQSIADIYECLDCDDERGVASGLRGLAECIRRMENTLSRMHENLAPADFYDILRPFYEGWGPHTKSLPEGLVYEGVSDTQFKFLGGSAAQSSTVQTVDAVLGIEHLEEADAYLKGIRDYMPAQHREFLYTIESGPSLRNYVKQGHDDVKRAYNHCLQALLDMRTYHQEIVIKYAFRPKHIKEGIGTGGTSFMIFLKSTRSQTAKSFLPLGSDASR